MNPGVTEEASKQVGTFMEIMRSQPLSLALVVMNFALVTFLFYSNAQTLSQRKEALDQIVQWQRATDTLMANCVSKDVLEIVVNALERDREIYRRLLPPLPQQPPQLPDTPTPKPQSIEYNPPFSMPP
jgi:hypothetical protein